MYKQIFVMAVIICLILVIIPGTRGLNSAPEEIIAEALRPNESGDGKPLPLAGHWNMGTMGNGFSPEYQMQMIERGHHLLPWFQMPGPDMRADDQYWLNYYEAAIKQAAKYRLPISFVGTQWEILLSTDDRYFNLPADENPNVIEMNGQPRREVSPLGGEGLWREVGKRWTTSPMMKRLQELYPDPPLVLFISNNEHPKLDWTRIEEEKRYMTWYGEGRDDEFKRKLVGDAWTSRYRAMLQGMREGLGIQKWRDNSRYVGYNAFGPSHFARWPGWMEYSLYRSGRIDPSPLAWDGGSPSFYVYNWMANTDFTVFSPQIEAMNWIFMQQEANRLNPRFWFEISTWDGHEPGADNDKRLTYARMGQDFSPPRYGGMVQFGMWLSRPRVVREFRNWLDTLDASEPYFLPIVDAVDKVYSNPILKEFWRKGQLVPNRSHAHPYETNVPEEYRDTDRWFLLDTALDPPRPWQLGSPLPVFSLALVKGMAPNRQWLVYAHAPTGARRQVPITIPEYGQIKVDVSVEGSFYLVDENYSRVHLVLQGERSLSSRARSRTVRTLH